MVELPRVLNLRICTEQCLTFLGGSTLGHCTVLMTDLPMLLNPRILYCTELMVDLPRVLNLILIELMVDLPRVLNLRILC
jgi:hypothetical protein